MSVTVQLTIFLTSYIDNTNPETCSDSSEDPWRNGCSSWKNYCSSHAGVQLNCQKTCNLCKNKTDNGKLVFDFVNIK